MKTLLPLLLLLSFFQSTFSQQFVRDDAQWVYNYHGAFSNGYTIISYEKDTVIDGRLVKQFGRYHTQFFPGFPDTLKSRNGPIFFYEDQGIVEFSISGTQFYPRLNYNLEFGDTIQVIDYFSPDDTLNMPYSTLFSTVSDTFHLDVAGEMLFSREVEYKTVFYDGRNDRIFMDTLVPYLGLLNQYINPADAAARAVDGGEGGFLRCYRNDELGAVESPIRGNVGGFAYDCDGLNPATSFEKPFDPSSILAYPNPSSDILIIENTKNKRLSLRLRDLRGKTHGVFSVTPGKNEISVSHLPAALYFLEIDGKAVEKISIN